MKEMSCPLIKEQFAHCKLGYVLMYMGTAE